VNIPIGVITLLLSRRMLNVADPAALRLDWPGLVTFSGGLFLLVLALTRGNDDGWSSTLILSMLASAAMLIVAFVIVELRQLRPMFDLSLFRKPAFTGVCIATFGIGAGMFALLPYITLYLQNELGLSPLQGGLRMLPLTVMAFVVPLVSRPVTERVPVGMALSLGLVTCAAGIWLFDGLTISSTWTALLPGMLVGGLGIGLANPAIAKAALGMVAPQRSGMASGISNTFRLGGVATGVAALGAVFQDRLQSTLHSVAGHQAPTLARLVAAGGAQAAARASGGRTDVTAAALHAFVNGMNIVIVVGSVTVFAGAAFAVLVRRKDFYSRRRAGQRPVAPVASDRLAEVVG
jgi:Major Facilitator Superfamily